MSDFAEGEIGYWVDLIIKSETGSDEFESLLSKIPPHLQKQVDEALSKYYASLKDESFKDAELEEEYKNDTDYGIDNLKEKDLEEGSIRLGVDERHIVDGVVQEQAYVRGKDMEEHHAAYEGMSEDDLAELNSFKRDTGSANQTDILPHLFKKQPFYKGIEDNLDKTIAVAKEGFSQVYLLTRTQKKASGSMFRKTAGLNNTEEELLARDLSRQGVIERKVENFNPFKGKFTFRTTYGPPPTASLSQSQARYEATLDLGQKQFGSDYLLYNTTTGSLSSGSRVFFTTPIKYEGGFILPGAFISTTASIIERLQFDQTTQVKYIAKWEQNITSESAAQTTIPVEYVQKRYIPSVSNGNLNTLFPTKKTVLMNGNIFIT